MNHYFALINANGESRVTLAGPRFGVEIAEDGTISGDYFWSGAPPPWCVEIVEVKSKHPWASVPLDERPVRWRRA